MTAVLVLASLLRFFSGSDVDAQLKLHGPYLILAGGGDYAPAMQAAIDGVRECTDCAAKIDVVVLRASGAEGYNPWFIAMNGVNSVTSLVITDRASAERDDVARTVRNAEIVFFAGGDQCNYIRWIKGTRTAEAVKSVYRRGGAVGGTSAGLAIQGDIAYDACPSQSAQSKDVLLDPYDEDVSLSRDFFDWPSMRNVITDTHFVQRDRLGRLLVFMARAMSAGDVRRVKGLGINAETVVLVDRKGIGRVMGKGPVYIIIADRKPEVIERETPLTYRGYKIWKFESGDTIDLGRDPKIAPKVIDVVRGKLSADPY
ncbi:MAG TPA: cyanophycinase [Thermoanaerobaculia bacterium]|jgi:cyanophycinase|nr:cyanophycinase [Thermoanaerobaculia bacterium]